MKPHKNNTPSPQKSRAFRPILLALIITVVCWSFWNNSQRRLNDVLLQGLVNDEVKALTSEERNEILHYIKPFRQDFGVPIEVNILKRPPDIKNNDISRIYIDISPEHRRAYLHFPPLVRNAVGQEFIREMEHTFQQGFAEGDWRPPLVSVILALGAKLREVTR